MENLIVLPMIIPLLTGIILIFLKNYKRIQQWMTILALLSTTVIAAYILHWVHHYGILRLDMGGWKPPFGILFVADSFSLLLVITSTIITIVTLIHAFTSIGKWREQMYFYPLVLFLLTGVNGSFLTGDIFNLFVCFEVMLLSSYVLLALGGTRIQLKASIVYVAINVLSSWFFLVAIAYLYRVVGTLNMAHIAVRVDELGQPPILTVIAIVFLLVFALKAGLMLYFWIPGSYSAPPTAIAALFGALLTKVGVYAIIRVFTLIFYHEPDVTHSLIGILAIVTMIGGSIGAVAYSDLRQIVTYNVVISIGFILAGLAVATDIAIEGSIYYLIHDMIVKALLFLIAGTIIQLTRTARMDKMSGLIGNYPVLGWLFFLAMLSLAGIPPFSGFIGKLLISQGTIASGSYIMLAVLMISGLFVLYSLLRFFLSCFWGETILSEQQQRPLKKSWLIPCVLLTLATFMLGVGTEWIADYIKDAALVLQNPDIYIDAVVKK